MATLFSGISVPANQAALKRPLWQGSTDEKLPCEAGAGCKDMLQLDPYSLEDVARKPSIELRADGSGGRCYHMATPTIAIQRNLILGPSVAD